MTDSNRIPDVRKLKCYVSNLLLLLLFLTPVLNSQGMKKITLCKEKMNAGMVNIPPPPSQNCHAEEWHCNAESEWRVAETKSWSLLLLLF